MGWLVSHFACSVCRNGRFRTILLAPPALDTVSQKPILRRPVVYGRTCGQVLPCVVVGTDCIIAAEVQLC